MHPTKIKFNFSLYVHTRMLRPVSQATPNVQCKEREFQGLPFIQYTALLFAVHEIVTDWCVWDIGRGRSSGFISVSGYAVKYHVVSLLYV
jgi:hypothetical protein